MKVCAIVLRDGDISIQRYNDISRHGPIDNDYSLVGEGEFWGGGRADRLLRVDQAERATQLERGSVVTARER